MASTVQENIGTHHEKISITIGKTDYEPSFLSSLKKQSKQVSLPGFRKGMVPTSVLKKMYGQGLFQEEVIRLAEKELEKYILENKIEFLARPLPSESQRQIKLDMNSGADYVFEFELATVPEVSTDLMDKKEKWTIYKVMVTETMIDEEVNRFQYRVGEMTEPEMVDQEDNVLNVVFSECDENGNAVEGGISKDNSLLLKYFKPEVQKELLGKKNEDHVVFQLKNALNDDILPAVIKDLELDPEDESAKEKHFNMKITKVGLVIKPEMNEDFFEKIYPGAEVKTEDAFREKVKEDIQKYWDGQAKNFLNNEIFERFVHETTFTLPDEFLKRWLLVSEEKYKTAEEVEADYGNFTHQIRWELIFKKIVEDNQLDVTPDEVREVMLQQLSNYFGGQGLNAEDDWVKSFIDKQLKDRGMYERTYREILNGKVFEFISSRIEKEEKEISVDEFIKVPHAHHH